MNDVEIVAESLAYPSPPPSPPFYTTPMLLTQALVADEDLRQVMLLSQPFPGFSSYSAAPLAK